MEFSRYRGEPGTWMIYEYNEAGNAYLISTHNTPLRAVEKRADLGKGNIGFLKLDMEFHDAVAWWERRDEEV